VAEVYRRDYHKRSSPPRTAARLAFDSRYRSSPSLYMRSSPATPSTNKPSAASCAARRFGDTNAVRRTYKSVTTALRRELEDNAASRCQRRRSCLSS